MKFFNKKKEQVKVTLDGRVHTVEPGADFEVNDENEPLCQAALDAGLETSDKLPTKKDDDGEKKGSETDKK